MALRIGGGRPAMPPMEEQLAPEDEVPIAEEPMPEDLMAELPESLVEEPTMEATGERVDQLTAGYLPPEDGPFTCGNCRFFLGEGACAIVGGEIHPDGCCNLYTKGQEEMPMDEPMPEEVPAEEPETEMGSEEGY